jgi:hypothetical protein
VREGDREARERRAEELRRTSEEFASEEEAERPPGSPHEFIEREMRERDGCEDPQPGDEDDREHGDDQRDDGGDVD